MSNDRVFCPEILENRRGGATEKIATHVDSLLQETKILGSLQYDGMKSRLEPVKFSV